MSASESRELDTGAAGASARREHERRRANRQQAVREKHPRTAALRLALASDPSHEMVWARGAAGEERVATAVWPRNLGKAHASGSHDLPPGASTVEFRLTPAARGTRVDLVHSDLPDASLDGHADGWTHFLSRLEIVAAGGDAGPDDWVPIEARGDDKQRL